MTATKTPTLVGPDVRNVYRLHTDTATIVFGLDYTDDPPGTGWHTRVFVDRAVAEASDPTLADLAAIERHLRSQDFDAEADALSGRIASLRETATLDIAADAAWTLVRNTDFVGGDIVRAVERARYDVHACWDDPDGECSCSPGVLLGTGLYLTPGRHKIRIDVLPPSTPETGEVPAALLDELTQYAIDVDSLDVTLGEAREGHRRTDTIRELIRRAYVAGRASVR